jgi:hypothetical protein
MWTANIQFRVALQYFFPKERRDREERHRETKGDTRMTHVEDKSHLGSLQFLSMPDLFADHFSHSQSTLHLLNHHLTSGKKILSR